LEGSLGGCQPCDGLLNNVFVIFSWIIKQSPGFSSVLPRLGRRLHWANRATGLSFLGWLGWNQWRVWRYRMVSGVAADGKPLSTNA